MQQNQAQFGSLSYGYLAARVSVNPTQSQQLQAIKGGIAGCIDELLQIKTQTAKKKAHRSSSKAIRLFERAAFEAERAVGIFEREVAAQDQSPNGGQQQPAQWGQRQPQQQQIRQQQPMQS